jgi:DNA gyrase subunit A
MGRATSGVTGMKFRTGDQLLSMDVVRDDDAYVFVVTDGGWAKRTVLSEYRVQGRGGLGIKVAKLNDDRGELVAGMVVGEDDEVLVVMEHGKVVRSPVAGVPAKGRDTMGVVFAKPDGGDRIIAIARNSERALGAEDEDGEAVEGPDGGPTADAAVPDLAPDALVDDAGGSESDGNGDTPDDDSGS